MEFLAMPLTELLIMLALGSGIASVLGIGGGLIFAPLFLDFYGMDKQSAVALASLGSLLAALTTFLSRIFRSWFHDFVEWKVVVLTGTISSIFSFLGAKLLPFVDVAIVRALFILLLAGIMVRTVRSIYVSEIAIKLSKASQLRYLLAITPIIGIISGLLGIGGGLFFLPLFQIVLGFDIRKAAVNSGVAVVVASIGGAAGHAGKIMGQETDLLFVLAAAIMIGSYIGGSPTAPRDNHFGLDSSGDGHLSSFG
jgi:uncharacterized protein